MKASPARLLARDPGDVIALRRGSAVTAATFLAQVSGLARSLPGAGPVINICEDRYHFLVGFAAALSRGLPTLLPPNPLDETVRAVHRQWTAGCVLTDAPGQEWDAPTLIVDAAATGPAVNPEISPGAVAAVAFTSGTTGSSVPQPKTWQTLAGSTAINLRYYLPAVGPKAGPPAGPTAGPPGGPVGYAPFATVSTVPAQHMYGLETTVLAALRGPVIMHDGRPFFPANIVAALNESSEPRLLVSTPVHLRALAASGLALPRITRVLSATAPLDPDVAGALERTSGAELIEIYGCTEVGSMAWRRTAVSARWRFFEGLDASQDAAGAVTITAAHLPVPVRLPDTLEFAADGSFALAGRDSDLVKIGGKRASLAEVTRLLMGVPGVDDAVVFAAPGAGDVGRLAALVVSGSLDGAAVRAALRPVLDPVFIPRPILIVHALPRSATGKLPRDAVLRLFADAVAAGSAGA